MNALLSLIGRVLAHLWVSANFVGRLVLLGVVGVPIIQLFVALVFNREAVAAVTAIGIVFTFVALFMFVSPLVFAIPAMINGIPDLKTGSSTFDIILKPINGLIDMLGGASKALVRWFVAAIAVDLIIGVYLSIVPVKNEPTLLLYLFLAVTLLAVLVATGWSGGFAKTLKFLAVGFIVLVTALFFSISSPTRGIARIEQGVVSLPGYLRSLVINPPHEDVSRRNDEEPVPGLVMQETPTDLYLTLPSGVVGGSVRLLLPVTKWVHISAPVAWTADVVKTDGPLTFVPSRSKPIVIGAEDFGVPLDLNKPFKLDGVGMVDIAVSRATR